MKNLLVPHMDTLLIPILQPGFHPGLTFCFLTQGHVFKEKIELFSECVEGLPPVAAPVLVAITHEDLVQQLEDVLEHGFVVGVGGEQSGAGNAW